MSLSLDAKRSAARKALEQFIGRGRDLTQVELNQMSAAVNGLIDDWRDDGMATLDYRGRPVDYVEVYRDEMNYNRVNIRVHVEE